MPRRTWVMVLLLWVAASASADEISREAALHELIGRTNLPLAHQGMLAVMEALRNTVPGALLDDLGRQGELGAGWKRGDAHWNQALALLMRGMRSEEEDGGPIFAVTRLDVERALRLPWTEDDIRFVTASLETPPGRALVATFDASFTIGLLASARDGLFTTDLDRRESDALGERARSQMETASLAYERSAVDDPERHTRLQALFTSGVASATSINEDLQKSWRRRMNTVMTELAPQLDRVMTDHRAAH